MFHKHMVLQLHKIYVTLFHVKFFAPDGRRRLGWGGQCGKLCDQDFEDLDTIMADASW